MLVNDTIPAPGRPVKSGFPVVATVARIAARQPARVAAEFGDDFVTYGRLHAVIEAYRTVTAAQGLDDKAAVYAAVVHTLPSLAAVDDAYTTAGEVTAILRHIDADDESQFHSPHPDSAEQTT
jgi:phage tail protein X